MPQVHQALQQLDRELALARQEKTKLLKLIHGYGSTGAGGDIRIAVQKRLLQMTQDGQLRACIFGENWSKSDDTAWKLLQSHPELKSDSDLGRRNQGITIVLLQRGQEQRGVQVVISNRSSDYLEAATGAGRAPCRGFAFAACCLTSSESTITETTGKNKISQRIFMKPTSLFAVGWNHISGGERRHQH